MAGKGLAKLGGDDARHYQALWHCILASCAVIAARAEDRNRWQAIAETHVADAAAAAGTRQLAGLTTNHSRQQLILSKAQTSARCETAAAQAPHHRIQRAAGVPTCDRLGPAALSSMIL